MIIWFSLALSVGALAVALFAVVLSQRAADDASEALADIDSPSEDEMRELLFQRRRAHALSLTRKNGTTE